MRKIFEDLLGQSARYIQPVLFRSGRLVVYAEAAVWGQHIRHRHATLLARCKSAGLHITDIKVKIRPGILAGKDATEKKAPSYNPQTAGRQLEQLAGRIQQEDLKQSLERLATRIRQNHLKEE